MFCVGLDFFELVWKWSLIFLLLKVVGMMLKKVVLINVNVE